MPASSASRRRRAAASGILGVADRANDDDPLGPGGHDRGDVAGVDASDREPGDGRRAGGYSISPSPVPGRPRLVGVSHTGPTLIWSGRSAPAAPAAVDLLGRMGGEPDEGLGTGQPARLGHRQVS